MRVVGVMPDAYGGPEALRLFELPDRHAGPGKVRIAVHAAAVNPTDAVVRTGLGHERQQGYEPPYVPGMDVAGIVDEVGPDTGTDLGVGDRVMAIVMPKGNHGGYSDSIVTPARSVVRIPSGATLRAAATLPMNGLTARLALDLLSVPPGGTIAVTGAAGTLGGYVVQLAKADDLRVIAVASERDERVVRSFGADAVVRRGDDLAARVREIMPAGVDGLVDTAVLGALILPAVRDRGGLAAVRPFAGTTERDIAIHQVWVREYRREREKLDRLRQQVEDGVLTLRVADTFPPERASEAHIRLDRGGTRGRLVIEFRAEPDRP
ncbi:quinone oxidoreductase family protein [Nocardia pseudovaccinii]|uniref:quinone oxidoreductase family protein n=1 Tax=Nocardia pseudovaccinii TaxID=189540 RepID=UPI0007A4582D|nr:NADP-dependent oxidoreductase [Nocardia pseudovaccinii]